MADHEIASVLGFCCTSQLSGPQTNGAQARVFGNANLLSRINSLIDTGIGGWVSAANCGVPTAVAQGVVIPGYPTAQWLQLSSTGAGAMSVSTPTGTAGIPVVPGQVYGAACAVNDVAALKVSQIGIAYYNAAGALIGAVNYGPGVTPNVLGTLTGLFVTAVAPANAAFAAIFLQTLATGGAAELHQFTCINLRAGRNVAGAYLDGGNPAQQGFDDGDFSTIGNLRARLKGISATTFTDARLNTMTRNDLIYAVRMNDYPSTVRA